MSRKNKLHKNESPVPIKTLRRSPLVEIHSLKQRKKYSEDVDKLLSTTPFVILQVIFFFLNKKISLIFYFN